MIKKVTENLNIAKTIEVAIKQNNTNKLYVIGDDTLTDRILKKELINTIIENKMDIQTEFLEDFNYKELKNHIKKIHDGVIVLFPYSLKNKEHYNFDFTAKELSNIANVPVYTFWSMFIENGCTGGLVVTPESQGEIVSQLARRVLSGEDINKIEVVKEDLTKYMFNWKRLKKFNISKNIPKDSLVLFKPKSLIESNPELIIILILLLFIIILLVILFIRIRYENFRLEKTINQKSEILNRQNEYIIQNEKMASLGTLVSGVAHEINTPLGVCITAFSYLKKINEDLDILLETNNITEEDFRSYQEKFKESTSIVDTNLTRAAELVQSFKRISVDQTVETKSLINMYEYINNIIVSLKHEYKNKDIKIEVHCEKDLFLTTYPGVLVQILTNFIMNSLIHGFSKDTKKGLIDIYCSKENNDVIIRYKDNGMGIPKEILDKIYDPFFTTKKNVGGSGLGLNIVFNLVTMKLKGKIKCLSNLGEGTEFIITFKGD